MNVTKNIQRNNPRLVVVRDDFLRRNKRRPAVDRSTRCVDVKVGIVSFLYNYGTAVNYEDSLTQRR